MDSLTSSGIYSASCSSYSSKEWEMATPVTLAFQQYFKDGLFTNVCFDVQGQDIRAHRLICALWSPVFAELLFGENNKEEKVPVEDVSPVIFKVLLQYMYGSRMSIYNKQKDVEFILAAYKAADKFDLVNMKKETLEILLKMSPNPLNIFQLLEVSRIIASKTLEQKCIKVLQTQTRAVLSSQDLANVSLEMLLVVLQLPRVSFVSESEVIMEVLAWAKNRWVDKSNTRSLKSILEDVLPYIEMTALSAKEFCEICLAHRDLLTEEEGFQIFMNITKPGSCRLPKWCTTVKRTYNHQ